MFLLFLFFHLPLRCDLLNKFGPLCSVLGEIPRLWQSFTKKLLQLVVSKPSVLQENIKQSFLEISKASDNFLPKLYGRVYQLPFLQEPAGVPTALLSAGLQQPCLQPFSSNVLFVLHTPKFHHVIGIFI